MSSITDKSIMSSTGINDLERITFMDSYHEKGLNAIKVSEDLTCELTDIISMLEIYGEVTYHTASRSDRLVKAVIFVDNKRIIPTRVLALSLKIFSFKDTDFKKYVSFSGYSSIEIEYALERFYGANRFKKPKEDGVWDIDVSEEFMNNQGRSVNKQHNLDTNDFNNVILI